MTRTTWRPPRWSVPRATLPLTMRSGEACATGMTCHVPRKSRRGAHWAGTFARAAASAPSPRSTRTSYCAAGCASAASAPTRNRTASSRERNSSTSAAWSPCSPHRRARSSCAISHRSSAEVMTGGCGRRSTTQQAGWSAICGGATPLAARRRWRGRRRRRRRRRGRATSDARGVRHGPDAATATRASRIRCATPAAISHRVLTRSRIISHRSRSGGEEACQSGSARAPPGTATSRPDVRSHAARGPSHWK